MTIGMACSSFQPIIVTYIIVRNNSGNCMSHVSYYLSAKENTNQLFD